MSTARVLFIEPDILKELYVLDTNIDDRILQACIYEAQQYYIQRLLGTQLYNRVKNEIDSGSVSNEIKTLLENYIEPALIQYTMSEVYKHLTYRLTNKGAVTKDSDNSTTVDITTIQKLRDEAVSRGNVYGEQMYRYLCANTTLYPEFRKIQNIADILPTLNYDSIGYGYERQVPKDVDVDKGIYRNCNL